MTDAQLIDAMLAHPILINRPIVVTPLGTRLCRPSELVLDILPARNKARSPKKMVSGGQRTGASGPDQPRGTTKAARACNAWLGRGSLPGWSLTRPMACMKAYTVVGPTKLQPRFFRSLDKATEAAVDVSVRALQASAPRAGRRAGPVLPRNGPGEPNSRRSSSTRRALWMVDSILPRWRTMAASCTSRSTSAWSKAATCSASNWANAARKPSRLFRMVSQLRPD